MTVAALMMFGAGVAVSTSAWAQSDDRLDRRLDRIEKDVRQLKSIFTQGRDTGQPVTIRLTNEPDPSVTTLQTRVDDLEAAARARNAQIETLAHDAALAQRDAADAKARAQALEDRLAKLEARLGVTAGGAATAPAPPTGVLGTLPAQSVPGRSATAAAPPAVSADEAFRQAKQLLLDGQYAAASNAFQSFVAAYGDTANAPEARYWLGETLFIRGLYSDAAAAYIGAVRGWPKTSWAPDAVVKLARALVSLNKSADACRTLDELGRRYPTAAASTKARAADARAAAKCAA
jgi:tol-pal system protein YbgF